jgi:hypothetical protein
MWRIREASRKKQNAAIVEVYYMPQCLRPNADRARDIGAKKKGEPFARPLASRACESLVPQWQDAAVYRPMQRSDCETHTRPVEAPSDTVEITVRYPPFYEPLAARAGDITQRVPSGLPCLTLIPPLFIRSGSEFRSRYSAAAAGFLTGAGSLRCDISF